MNYYYKYIKYKTKYLSIKNDKLIQEGGKNNKYYFIHNTTNYDNLISILKTGEIKISSQVEKERRKRTSGNVNFIFGTMYLKSLNNLTHMPDYTLILSEKLLDDYEIRFNKGWTGNELTTIKLDDNNKDKKNKLSIVKRFIKNPKDLPEKLRDPTGLMIHEVLFSKNIPLDKYLLGITCNNCTNEQINEIKKYTSVNIYTSNIIPNI